MEDAGRRGLFALGVLVLTARKTQEACGMNLKARERRSVRAQNVSAAHIVQIGRGIGATASV
ncbi:hypothetical protein BKD09_15830 [Bradyrhizobium japonicum]|uniref:Uncharacterized protein n=1 Tax=Bradyrhizobium japonicum TaxID=375 RepID=A0A1L3F939_BRAJP|nr:hypothetical protein BKD09_15830 [Bradyrhizobium japonicum]